MIEQHGEKNKQKQKREKIYQPTPSLKAGTGKKIQCIRQHCVEEAQKEMNG